MPSLGGSGQYGGDDPTGGYSGGSSGGGSYDPSRMHKAYNRSAGIGVSNAGGSSERSGGTFNQIGNFFSGTIDQLSSLMSLSPMAKGVDLSDPQTQQSVGFFDTLSNIFSGKFSFSEDESLLQEEESPLEKIGKSVKEFLGIEEEEDKIQDHWTGMPPAAAESLPEYNAMAVLDGWTPGKDFKETDLDSLISAYKKHAINKRGLSGQIFGTGIDEEFNFKERLVKQLAGLAFDPLALTGPIPIKSPIGKTIGNAIANAIRTDRIDRATIDPQLRSLGFSEEEIDAGWRDYHDTGDFAKSEGGNAENYTEDEDTEYIDEATGKPILNPYYIYRYGDQFVEEEVPTGSSLEGPLKGSALRETGDEDEEMTTGEKLLLDIFTDGLLEQLEVF